MQALHANMLLVLAAAALMMAVSWRPWAGRWARAITAPVPTTDLLLQDLRG